MSSHTTPAGLDATDHATWSDAPFFAETVELLRSVRDHDFDTLAARCDDDFGIVDLDQSGASVMIRTRADWEAWFHRLFAELDAMSAATDSEILSYDATAGQDMGFSVVEFRQSLTMGDATGLFDCVATIVWKLTPTGWKEARWHVSLLSADIPDAMRQ